MIHKLATKKIERLYFYFIDLKFLRIKISPAISVVVKPLSSVEKQPDCKVPGPSWVPEERRKFESLRTVTGWISETRKLTVQLAMLCLIHRVTLTRKIYWFSLYFINSTSSFRIKISWASVSNAYSSVEKQPYCKVPGPSWFPIR